MFLNEREMSEWAYFECRKLRDDEKEDVDCIWKVINDSEIAYMYCKNIEDKKEVWSKITKDYWRFRYCLDVKDRKELWSKIRDDWEAYRYCSCVKDRPEVHQYLEVRPEDLKRCG